MGLEWFQSLRGFGVGWSRALVEELEAQARFNP